MELFIKSFPSEIYDNIDPALDGLKLEFNWDYNIGIKLNAQRTCMHPRYYIILVK